MTKFDIEVPEWKTRTNSFTCYQAAGDVCSHIGLKKNLEHSQSQEEAALVLQKHYRGFQARNKNNSAKNDNLDPAARKLISKVCNKWRGKSIYQVLLLDRSKKLQDVVYFSLQVHMYNQHVICKLNSMNHRPVVLGNVMSTTSVSEFLGSKKCYSYKIPFQLNQMDMTFCQNYLTSENMTSSSIDESNWDAPLKRFSEARTAYKILKHKFTVRDQGVQVELGGGVQFTDDEYNNPHIISDQKRAYEKHEKKPTRQQPPAVDNRYSTKEVKDAKTVTTTSILKPAKPVGRSNPILELQSRGKQYDYADEDDPPYNFQAILKKTNYKRPSMDGRSVQYTSETSGGGGKVGSVTARTYGQPPEVPTRSADHGRPTANDAKRSKDYKNELNQQLSRASRTELLPGVMLEGSSYDL